MKYKLINFVSKKETICDKVTIDGFDYYVSDEERLEDDYVYENNLNQEYKISKVFKRNNELGFFRFRDVWIPFSKQNSAKKVIATNNSDIDIFQILEEPNEDLINQIAADLGYRMLPEDLEEGIKAGYNQSQETHPFSEEDLISFAHFYFREEFNSTMQDSKSTEEILQLWKEQQHKIIYYQ